MDLILGIDLGTTNSLVGVVDSGFPILLADAEGQRLMPSVVYYPAEGGLATVGWPALRQRVVHPDRTVFSVKRLIGRREGESGWQPPYDLATIGKTPVEVSSNILRRLKNNAERAMDTQLSRAVITVPAYFNDAQRNATKLAGEMAGLTVERILSEPTAAALAYGLDKLEESKKIAVYDLGGGTFDISILEMRDGVFQVLATAGDTQLGGDDIDGALVEYLAGKITTDPDKLMLFLKQKQKGDLAILREAAQRAKEDLSSKEETDVVVPFLVAAGEPFQYTLTRRELELLARQLIERTRRHCLRAMTDANLQPADLDEVILVGGSTRMPLVRTLVQEIFQREPNTSQNPDEAVALGAVIQAGILGGALRNVVLLDVTPLSLGIETFGGLMNIIIPRNSTIPCKAGEMFTNAVANQSEMLIRVLQGEREMARDNWDLGSISVPFPPGEKGSARVGVQFSLDANGILQVLTRDTATNTDTVLEIQSSAVDVDDAKVEKMIAESVDFAFEDMNERIWTEARMKSDELLNAVDEALIQCAELLKKEDVEEIQSCAARVREARDSEPHDARLLKTANQALDDATQSLAVLLVERAMEAALERKLA